MSKIECDGDCYSEEKKRNNMAEWKVIMNKTFRKNYRQKKIYLCNDCIEDLLAGIWTGGGPYGSDVKKIIKIKGGEEDE